ncbi:hypothetical protein [Gluconobacter roseus]|uniref:Lipoyl-binding domain-containing protein n=1 Tax=Gluconobacter roseus NBRC 3990 TaxID=1307950 RepID=A0A4Y3M920_9PROT|nr:hypothetical protein [Gluconobacter roseus]KXV45104.1 hypothetical protein AD943_00545 [Gluconobacter roseus]GBR43461.1 hypothetical protein AA3990_0432 [Gluconobacter roseus NBRC 3990]GEB05073.1 hypothetical protein GRO01_26490 [Gluconobacter roseus NBRC 3990]GLP94438.1 hypothetical protein GCM10007871_24160 [Gluconobacter roseus NBRC 3990]
MTFLEDLLNELPDLVSRMRHYDVRHVSLKNEMGAIALTVTATPCQTAHGAPAITVEDIPVLSPEMGRFRQNGLSEGQTVWTGEIIGFVETGVLRLPVTATTNGILGPAEIGDGSLVGYHDILFRIHQGA